MTLTSSLADWLRPLFLVPDPQLMDSRAAIIDGLAGSVRIEHALEIARLYLGHGAEGVPYIPTFKAAFLKGDDQFPQQGNDLELQMLAGATLVAILEKSGEAVATATALAIASVCDAGWVKTQPIWPTAIKYARNYLLNRANTVRSSGAVPETLASHKKVQEALTTLKKLDDAVGGPEIENDTALQIAKQVPTVSKALSTRWTAFTGAIERANVALQQNSNIATEQAEMLWWLVEQHRIPMEVSGEVAAKAGAAAIMLGDKLADLCHFLPGPVYGKSFLHEALRLMQLEKAEGATVRVAIENTTHEWKQRFVSDVQASGTMDFSPVASATALLIGTLSEQEIAPWFCSVPFVDQPVSPPDLAYQIFTECLLQQAVAR